VIELLLREWRHQEADLIKPLHDAGLCIAYAFRNSGEVFGDHLLFRGSMEATRSV
jgi:hypothetical protein